MAGIDPTAVIGRPPQHREYRAGAWGTFPVYEVRTTGGVSPGRVPGVFIHPDALVEKLVQVDAGAFGVTQIRAEAWVMAGTHVAHDCIIGERCEIAAGVIMCGHVEIGEDVRVGVGAMFRSFVKVGECARIGMGSVVVEDVAPYECWAGNPARKLYDLCVRCGKRDHGGDCE